MLEDSSPDAEIVDRILKKEFTNCDFHLAMTEKYFMEELDTFDPDVILADNSLPHFNAIEALKRVRQRHLQIPFIMVTGAMSEEFAANIIKSGADDYILKDRLTRLPSAIDAAIKKHKTLKSIVDYRYALDQSAIVSITDQNGIIIYANDNFVKISKYSTKELLGKDHRIINSGYHPASYMNTLWATIISGKKWRDDMCNKAKDGSLYWVDTHIIPFMDERGKPYQYMAICTDISKRKKVEKKLQTAYDQLSFHLINAPLGFIEWDNQLHAKYWSKRTEEIFGWTEKEFISLQKDGYTQVYEEDMPIASRIAEDLITGKVGRNSVQYRNYTKNGTVIWCEWFNSVLKDKDGKVNTILSLVRDITESKKIELAIKQNESTLNKAQQLAHIGNWDVNLIDNIDVWSDEMYRILGIKKGEIKPSLEQFLLCIHPEEIKSVQKTIQESRNSVSDARLNFRFIRKDGTIRYGYIEWRYEFNEKGMPERLFGILQDITERKEVEMEFQKLEKEKLEGKIEEQKNLAKAILNAQEKERTAIGKELHDNVNQILAGTNLFLSIAKKTQEKNLEHIESSMQNIQQAIEANRKIAHELVSPGFDEIQLAELINNLSENMLKKNGIKVNLEVNMLNEDLLNDEQKLSIYRIAQEQCTNITKYAEAKSVEISLSTVKGDFKMVIADDGKGMPVGKKINGIGLRNIKGRVNILNGNVNIVTNPARGFALEISIPL